MTCRQNDSCVIQCPSDDSCGSVSINANGATDVNLNCAGDRACQAADLVCGSGNCTIDCSSGDTDVCKDIIVDTSTYFLNTSNFKCIGDSCPSFTVSPSTYPTINPSKSPVSVAPTCRYCNYCGRPQIIQLEYSMQSELSITHNQYIIN